MSDPSGKLRDLFIAIKAYEAHTQSLQERQKEVEVLLEELRAAIAAGGTTGTNAVDVVICAGMWPTSSILARYRRLEKALAGKTGELVLVPYSEEERLKYGGPGQSEDETVKKVAVGVLNGEKLAYGHKRGAVGLPVIEFEICQSPFDHSIVAVDSHRDEGPLCERLAFSTFFYFTLPGDEPVESGGFYPVESAPVFIGNEAVRTWIASHCSNDEAQAVFRELAEKAGLLQLTSPVEDPKD